MIRMKKLVSSGIPGSDEGYVARGREFSVPNESRAKDLENAGLAYRLDDKSSSDKTDPPPSNKAAEAGPLVSRGGKTGAKGPVRSSLRDLPQRKRRSER